MVTPASLECAGAQQRDWGLGTGTKESNCVVREGKGQQLVLLEHRGQKTEDFLVG